MDVVLVAAIINVFVDLVDTRCSHDVRVDQDDVMISSPGFIEGRNYDVDSFCTWSIRSVSNISVSFIHFDIEYHYLCEWDYVMIYDGECGTNTATKYCGTVAPSNFTGEATVCVEFQSDHVVTRTGFKAIIIGLTDVSSPATTHIGVFSSTVKEPDISIYSNGMPLYTSFVTNYHSFKQSHSSPVAHDDSLLASGDTNLRQLSPTVYYNTLQSSMNLHHSHTSYLPSYQIPSLQIDIDLYMTKEISQSDLTFEADTQTNFLEHSWPSQIYSSAIVGFSSIMSTDLYVSPDSINVRNIINKKHVSRSLPHYHTLPAFTDGTKYVDSVPTLDVPVETIQPTGQINLLNHLSKSLQTFSLTRPMFTKSVNNSHSEMRSSVIESSIVQSTPTESISSSTLIEMENNTISECGVRSSNLTKTNETDSNHAYEGQWPWMVGIQKDGTLVCGGSLLSNTWVVTAGHCLTNFINLPHLITVVVGTTSGNGSGGEIMRIAEIARHPQYDSIYRADIALLRLQNTVKYTNVLRPICLRNQPHSFPMNASCFVAGWGIHDSTDDSSQVFTDTLKFAKVDVWNNSDCSKIYPMRIDNTVICASNRNGRYDTCKGDSGGPLMCIRNDHDHQWDLIGTTSWGEPSCNGIKYPGVYTNIDAYFNWVESVLVPERPVTKRTCDFESFGICGIEVFSNGSFTWTKRRAGWTYGGQPIEDKTKTNKEGHYLYADSYMGIGSKAVFELQPNQTTSDECLRFWYTFQGNSKVKLKIEELDVNSFSKEILKLSSNLNGWQKAEVDISTDIISIRFIALHGTKQLIGGIAIDDISLTMGKCTGVNDGSCNFDYGKTCGYTNSSDAIGKWITQSVLGYESKDHVITFDGGKSPVNIKAILISTPFRPSGPRCFTFQYRICGPAYTLSVLIGYLFNDIRYFGNILWTESRMIPSCSEWRESSVNIQSMPINYFVAIEAEKGDKPGTVFLDNFKFTPGNCN